MTDTPTPPAGWYPDPAGSGGTRRWDGTAWTDEVRPAEGIPADAADTHAVASAGEESTPSAVGTSPEADPGAPGPSTPVAAASEVDASEATPEKAPSSPDDAQPAAPEASVTPAPEAPVTPASAPPAPGHPAASAPLASAQPATGYPAAPAAPASAPAASAPAGYPAFSSASAPVGTPGHAPAHGYPAAPGTAARPAPTTRDIPTDTVWIWLVVALPLVSVLALFLFDWRSMLEEGIYAAVLAEQGGYSSSVLDFSLNSTLFSAGMGLLSLVIGGLSVLFSFLDWRQLRARGIEKPFHWAWSFFVFVATAGVYVIGRGIVLRRQTGKGLGPIWGFIAVTIVSIAIAAIWLTFLLRDIFALMQQLMYTYGY